MIRLEKINDTSFLTDGVDCVCFEKDWIDQLWKLPNQTHESYQEFIRDNIHGKLKKGEKEIFYSFDLLQLPKAVADYHK